MSTVQPYQRSSRKSEAEMNIFFSLGQEQTDGLSKETAEVNAHGLPTRRKPFPKDMSYGAGHPDSMSGVLSPTSTIRDAERRLFVLDRAVEEPDERLETVLAGILDFDDVFDESGIGAGRGLEDLDPLQTYFRLGRENVGFARL